MSYRLPALAYHRFPTPGKIATTSTKALAGPDDLALAYSPGVAAACERIVAAPAEVAELTARANLVGVITNGTAVLGLGAIGPLAAKPVMEGKAVLFKEFAGIDVFDLEVDEKDPDRLVDLIAALEPTFGGINLEDIKAPECFYVEERLRERLRIPVFHDDQHGTAIVVAAALLNALTQVGKSLRNSRLVTCGAGAAALACLNLLEDLGLSRDQITVCDLDGVVYDGRCNGMDPFKARYARATDHRTLAEAIENADVFLGLSTGGVLTSTMIASMATQPIVFALANPEPEMHPADVYAARPDAIVATGRSDYPNQVNNALCFPYIFRGALDVGATRITREMELAAVSALARLSGVPQAASTAISQAGRSRPALLPEPFDRRLLPNVAGAVAQAAMASGVATRPIHDLAAYRQSLATWRAERKSPRPVVQPVAVS
jgi:malate dehydrogenase (oxaloacetate-decarboxylating)(NADP+)